MKRGFFCLAWLAAAAGANAQCYQFSGSGVSLQINITSILLQTPNFLPGGGYLTTIAFSSNNTFTAGGSTFTSQAMDDAEGTLQYTPPAGGIPGYTNLHLIVPTNQQDTLSTSYNWQITLFGAGNLIPSGTLPQVLPAISQWVFQTAEEVIGTVSGPVSNPATALYNITSVTGCNSGGGTPPPDMSATSPTQDLGDPSSLPGDCGCTEPVNLATGNLYYEVTDYRTAGANPLQFTRYYNSLGAASATTLATSLGTNWRSNYDRYLQLSSSSSVIAERPNGQQVTFALNGGTWTTDTDIDLALTNSGSTWTLTDHWDTIETYQVSSATEAVLQSIQARNGYTQSMQYNGGGKLASVTDSFFHTLTFTYNNGLLQDVITPDGLLLTYGFTSGVLTSVGYSTSPPTSQQYVYGNSSFPAALTGIIDENGATYISWTYDSMGRALTGQLAGGVNLNTIVYNDSDGSRTVTNALGETETYKFTTLQSIPKVTEVDRHVNSAIPAATSTYAYDSNGYTSSHADWNGNLTTYVNDAHGQPLTINEAVGTPQARTTAITYLANFHLPAQIVTSGMTTSFTYDNHGEVLTRTVTDTTSNGAPYSTNGQSRTWTYTWSNFLEASIKTPRTDVSNVTQMSYDATGALTSVTNALNQTYQLTKHQGGGLPETIVDPNGVTTNLTYDARQRLLSTAITTSAGVLATSYSYDAAGNLTGVTGPDGSAIAVSYDAAHRITGLADLLNQKLSLTLDALGDRTQETWLNASGVAQRTHSGVFDALGRMLQDIGGSSQTTAFTYDSDANIVTVIDPLVHKTQLGFDALNRLVTSTNPGGGQVAVTYDAHDRPLSATDPDAATTNYIFDGFGDAIERVSPATGTTVLRYDADGGVIQQVDARGVIVNYAYDALDRLVSATYPGDSAENVTYTYDQAGHGFGIGRITSLMDAAGTSSFTYDERGNQLSASRVQGSATLVTTYAYDQASRIVSIVYPSKTSVTYSRDKMGRITQVAAKAPGGTVQPVASAITYQPFGPITGLTYGNGIAETRSFDQDYRMTTLASSGNAQVQSLTYSYDGDNNVLSIADSVTSANSQNFSYDALNHLNKAAGGYGALGYTYDANGNRLTESNPPSAMDGLSAVTNFSYNQAGRLASASAGNQQVAQYTYDSYGQRIVKQGTAATTIYQYDQDHRLLEEANGQGVAQSDYIYLNGRPIAMLALSTGGQLYFLHDDRLGTPQVATDKNQTSAWVGNYLPFGALNAASSQTATLSQDLRLPGQIADLETGLSQNGLRYDASGWGRYTQSDLIGLAGGLNT